MKEQVDVLRLMQFFETVLGDLAAQLTLKSRQAFFVIPIVRMFSFFVQRLQLSEIIEGTNYHISEKIKNAVLPLIAAHNGFIAELRAKLWIYKGEGF